MMHAGSRRGFTLLEVLIAAAVGAVILAATFSVLFTTIRQDETLRVQMEMQVSATQAMREIASLLKTSGPVDLDRDGAYDDGDWPVFAVEPLEYEPRPSDPNQALQPGTFPEGAFDGLNMLLTPAYKLSSKDDDFPENQASTEIAFRLPVDTNNDGYPTDASGRIEWSSDVYVICHEARSPVEWLENGNVLELRRYDPTVIDPETGGWTLVSRKVLANWVERVLIQSRSDAFYKTGDNDSTLGLDQLRITIWFRRNDVSKKRERQVAFKQVSCVLFRSVDR